MDHVHILGLVTRSSPTSKNGKDSGLSHYPSKDPVGCHCHHEPNSLVGFPSAVAQLPYLGSPPITTFPCKHSHPPFPLFSPGKTQCFRQGHPYLFPTALQANRESFYQAGRYVTLITSHFRQARSCSLIPFPEKFTLHHPVYSSPTLIFSPALLLEHQVFSSIRVASSHSFFLPW